MEKHLILPYNRREIIAAPLGMWIFMIILLLMHFYLWWNDPIKSSLFLDRNMIEQFLRQMSIIKLVVAGIIMTILLGQAAAEHPLYFVCAFIVLGAWIYAWK